MTPPAVIASASTRLDSPARAGRLLGATVKEMQALDVIERLLKAAQHPDIAKVERYGPGDGPWGPSESSPGMKTRSITGVKVTHQSTATASLWLAIWPDEKPVPVPAVMPPPARRTTRLLMFAMQLLDLAQPAQFTAWHLVALPDLGRGEERGIVPAGLSLKLAGGGTVLLRATSTGPTLGEEPAEEPFPDYVIPEEVKSALHGR